MIQIPIDDMLGIEFDKGVLIMAIKVIYKDKNIGMVNETRLNELITKNRIAAYCLPNGGWVGVHHDLKNPESGIQTFSSISISVL